MKISVSSLYFKPLTSPDLKYLSSIGVKAIELVIYHQFETYEISDKMINFKKDLKQNNLEISGIQGFTFKPNLDLKNEFFSFSDIWIKHLNKLKSCAIFFQTNKLVFGAPSFRSNINEKEKFEIYFKKTLDFFKLYEIDLLLEAVPKLYGANFLNKLKPVFEFNKIHSLMNHFDTGCYLNESKNSSRYYPIINSKINHLHLSSTSLGLISKDEKLLKWLNYFGLPKADDNFIVLESTLKFINLSDIKCDIDYLNKIITNET